MHAAEVLEELNAHQPVRMGRVGCIHAGLEGPDGAEAPSGLPILESGEGFRYPGGSVLYDFRSPALEG